MFARLARFANTAVIIYQATPRPLRWLYWIIPVLYFVSPLDLMPDMAPLIGRVDDILFFVAAILLMQRAQNMAGFFKQAKQHKKRGDHLPPPEKQAGDPLANPHAVLGIDTDADADGIRKAYRKQLTTYHPDRFSHLGPEFEAVAAARTRAIVKAYETLRPRNSQASSSE